MPLIHVTLMELVLRLSTVTTLANVCLASQVTGVFTFFRHRLVLRMTLVSKLPSWKVKINILRVNICIW